jgi:hypothetical protein
MDGWAEQTSDLFHRVENLHRDVTFSFPVSYSRPNRKHPNIYKEIYSVIFTNMYASHDCSSIVQVLQCHIYHTKNQHPNTFIPDLKYLSIARTSCMETAIYSHIM